MKQGYSFLSDLTSHYETFKTETASIDNLIKEMEYYESFIPDFFSQNGEADGIKNMYSEIRTMMENGEEKTIECIDIGKSSSIYYEYLDGMIKFINDIKNVNTVDSDDALYAFTEKFNSAKDKDSLFIQSLYNGKLSESTDMLLSEAVTNIEFLIDFIPNLKTMKSNCCMVQESIKEVTDDRAKCLLDQCATMLCESVNNFCYSTIKAVTDTYSGINQIIYNESVNDEPTVEEPFKLLWVPANGPT